MARKLSFEVLIRSAYQSAVPKGRTEPTKRELARILGVSPRTVGRWLADESKPRADTLERLRPTLQKQHAKSRRVAERLNRKADADPPFTQIPVAGVRKMIAERDIEGNKTGREYSSDWVNYDVSTLDTRALFDFLRGLAERGAKVQIVYKVPKGGTSLGGRDYPNGGQASTGAVDLDPEMGDSALWDETLGPLHEHPGKPLRTVWIAVLE